MDSLNLVTDKAAEGRLRLGHRTHSIVAGDGVTHDTVANSRTLTHVEPVTGVQSLPESLVKVKLFPGGDVQVTVVDRHIRPPKVVERTKRSTGELSEDDALRSNRRARRGIWEACQSKNVNCMITIAKRGGIADYDEVWTVADAVLGYMKERGWIAGHVTVPELHTGERVRLNGMASANKGTWHIHIATRVCQHFPFAELHEYMKIIEGRLYGHIPRSPQERMLNVDVALRRGRRQHKRHTPASIASYLAPYVIKALEDGQSRELNRKRYDVSRDGNKPTVWTIKCNPGEMIHRNAACVAILQALAPGRKLSSPWATEVAGQDCLIMSALDWGDENFALPTVNPGDVTASSIFALISTELAAARRSRPSELPVGAERAIALANQLHLEGSHRPIAKRIVGQTRPDAGAVRAAPDAPSRSLHEHLRELWPTVADGPAPWDD